MSINVQKLEQAILDKMNSSSTELELLEYSKMLTELKTGIVQVVDTFASLPTASESVGHLYYVQDEKTVYWANASAGWITLETQSITRIFVSGDNFYGQLMTNNVLCYSSPVQEITSGNTWNYIGNGRLHSSAIKCDGTLWSAGYGFYGRLGNNSISCRCSPVQEASLSTNWCMSRGGDFSIALKTDGTLWAWGGQNAFGELATNNAVCYSSPVQEITSSSTWIMICAGTCSANAIKSDGTLWSWGCSSDGILGDSSTVNKSSPVQEASSSTDWCYNSMGHFTTSGNAAGIKTTGTLWSWGEGTSGKNGTNNVITYSSPVQEVSSSTNWCLTSISSTHATAIKTDGTLWTWGCNACGQLALGNVTSYSSPVQEFTSTTNWCNVKSIFCNSAAIKTDGTLWSWGSNSGQFMTNDIINYSSPVQEITSGANWSDISHGAVFMTALEKINF